MFAKLPAYLRTIHARVMILILIVGIIPYAWLGYSNLTSQRNDLIRQSEQLLLTSSDTIAIVVDSFIAETERAALGIATHKRIVDLDQDALPDLLNELHNNIYTDLAKLAVIDLNGNILYASDRPADAPPTSVAHIESYKMASRGEQGWVVDENIGSPELVIHMHTPIRDGEGQIVAILGTPTTFEALAGRVSAVVAEDLGANVYIVERENKRVILTTNSAERDFASLAPYIYSETLANEDHIGDYTVDGTAYQIGFNSSAETNWIVVTERPLTLAYPETLQNNRFQYAAVAAIFILGMALAYVASNIVTQPVRQLVKAAEALGADQLDVPLPDVSGSDYDAQILINAFSRMRDAVNERQDKLVQSEEALRQERNQLSTRVHERTIEIQRTNSKLEKALEQKEAFLSRVSHELRTPLNIILGMSEALMQGVYKPLSSSQTGVVTSIHSSGEHLLSMIDNIMNVSKLMSGENDLVMQPFVLHEVCLAVIDEVREICEERSIELRYVPPEDTALILNGDSLRIMQILCHLMANAVRFTPVGGKVGIHVFKPSLDEIMIAVWDTGIGIAKADFGRIFEPFEQIDNRLSREYEGAGLGLALAKQYALLHGGDIELDSTLHEGSKFKLILPLKQVTEQPALVKPTTNTSIRPKILLAEDNELAIQTVTDYLVHFGYEIIPARTGHEVLAIATTATPDLILMDVQMPGIDGLECTRRLRQDPHIASVPIIALTGMAMKQDEARCIAAGANAYMSKPVVLKDLRARIDSYLS